jgi:hypothetical protein
VPVTSTESGKTRKTTLYRLHEVDGHPDELRKVIVRRYVDSNGFVAESVQVHGIPSLLVYGTISRGAADWSAVLQQLTGTHVEEINSTAAAALLIHVGQAVYALSYGMGYLLIDPQFIDPGSASVSPCVQSILILSGRSLGRPCSPSLGTSAAPCQPGRTFAGMA